MKTITINVPDEMQEEIAAWEDGVEYAMTVRQVGEGVFDLVSTGDDPESEDEGDGMEDEDEAMPKKKMPASVAVLIGKK